MNPTLRAIQDELVGVRLHRPTPLASVSPVLYRDPVGFGLRHPWDFGLFARRPVSSCSSSSVVEGGGIFLHHGPISRFVCR